MFNFRFPNSIWTPHRIYFEKKIKIIPANIQFDEEKFLECTIEIDMFRH